MSTIADGDDEDADINPVTMLLPEDADDMKILPISQRVAAVKEHLQEHFICSINSTVVIRQLPSQGLSFQLWPAATTLVSLLDQHCSHPSNSILSPIFSALTHVPNYRPLNILELGSGTGLVGIIAAATLGAKVTVTDLPHVLPNLQFNAEANLNILGLNGGSVRVAPLRWGEADDLEVIGREFDLVLASDVVYHDHLYEPLIQTLRSLLLGGDGNEKMVFVMAHLRRWKKESAFFKKAKKLFRVDVLHSDRPSQGSRVGVAVYCFSAKGNRESESLTAIKAGS